MKNKGNGTDEILPLEGNNKVIYNNREKAHCFSKYFHSQSMLIGNDDPLPVLNQFDSFMDSPTVTVMEVTNIINNLNTRKAVGPDLIHNMLLKSACSVLVKSLTTLFKKSIAEGMLPSI